MKDESAWKAFESTGSVRQYLRYKDEERQREAGEHSGNSHDGSGSPGGEGGGGG